MVCVDWAPGATDPNYVRAAVNTRLVGKQTAIFLSMINDNIAEINGRTHMIGFSLGAHVAGFAGSELKNLSRITGTLSCSFNTSCSFWTFNLGIFFVLLLF